MSTDLSIILKITAQNDATPILEKVTASLKETGLAAKGLTAQFDLLASATTRLTEGVGKLDAALLRLPGRFNDASGMMRANIDQVNALAAAYGRLSAESSRVGGSPSAAPTGSAAERSGGGGFGIGSMVMQGAVFGGAYAAYSGIKASVGQAINFGATAASTQATTGISSAGLQQVTQGILSIASSGNSRYDANTLLQGAYAIISTGVTNPQQILSQLRAAAASATSANAPDVLSSTSALTTLMNAYGATGGAMKFQDIIQMAINQGKADPTQVPSAFATFARSAKTAGVTAAEAGGAFAFDTLASRDAQTSGQDMDALFRLVNNPNMASRTFAKALPGLDWGTGMVQRAGGLDKWMQNLLARTAGPNQGLLLSHLVNNAPALAAVEGVAADQGKFSQYLADAGGTGKTLAGAKTFMDSPEGKLFGATNELKTEFQKFSDHAIPLLTTAVGALTSGFKSLDTFGSMIDQAAKDFNLRAKVDAAGNAVSYSPSEIAAASRPATIQGVHGTVRTIGRFTQFTSDSGNVYTGVGGTYGNIAAAEPGSHPGMEKDWQGNWVRTSGPSRNQASPSVQGGIAPPFYYGGISNMPAPILPSVGGASSGFAGDVASASGAVSVQASQSRAVALAGRTSGQRRTGDMVSASAAFNMAMATGQPLSVIHDAEQNLEAAIRDSGMDANSIAYARQQAKDTEANYRQSLLSTAAASAATATSAGYQHVQAALQVAQITHSGVASATAAEASFIRAHPTLWNNDPTQLQLMLLQLNQQQAVSHAAATGPNLIRPNLSGLGALQSGAMATAALYGRQGGAAESKSERNLEAQLAEEKEQNESLRRQLRVAQDQLGVLRDSYEVNKQMLHVLTPAAHAGNHARRPHAHSVSS